MEDVLRDGAASEYIRVLRNRRAAPLFQTRIPNCGLFLVLFVQ
jgi:hypothetical protein